MSQNLKPCPACEHDDPMTFPDFVACSKSSCAATGPSDDFDGAKWNDMPRRGDAPPAAPAPTVTRKQIVGEIVALMKAAPRLETVEEQEEAYDAVRARMKWLIAQPVPEVR